MQNRNFSFKLKIKKVEKKCRKLLCKKNIKGETR